MAFFAANQSRPDEGVIEENVEITPALAEDMLKGNINNRTMRQYVVEAYARDMVNGNWTYTGDAIRLDKDGNVLDGQHRLAAVVLANKAFYTKVIKGLPAEARKAIDTGIPRNAADVFRMDGSKYARDRAAVLRQWTIIQQNYSHGVPVNTTRKITISEIEKAHAQFGADKVQDAVAGVNKLYIQTRVNKTAAATLLLLADEVGRGEDAAIFLNQIETGSGLAADSPALAIRNAAFRLSQARLTSVEWLAHLILAFNKAVEGKKMARVPSMAALHKRMSPAFPKVLPS